MSNTINIGGIQVSKFYLGGSSDVKIYLGTTKLYPHLQEPCFAVVDDITQYSDRTYVDVFNLADDKWYKLNNLSQYEEYGVYGSGRTITTYDGKLTIDDGYEYMYSGGSWINVGEVSGGTASLPDVSFVLNYNAKDYDATTHSIPQTSGQTKGIDAICNINPNNIVDHSSDGYISVTGNTRLTVSGGTTSLGRNNTQTGCTMTIVSKALTKNNYSLLTCRGSSGVNTLCWMYRQYTDYVRLHGKTDSPTLSCSTSNPSVLSVKTYYDSEVKSTVKNWDNNTTTSGSYQYYNNFTNGALFCDYLTNNDEFWKGDFYWVYMSQEVLTDEQVQQVIAYNEGGGQTEYPVYYDEIQDPPNNLSFSSMTEAEEYECPWVGMYATIDGDNYVFSGDSQSGYEWVYDPSRLPSGYTEVEYVENQNQAYINTGFKPNQDTRIYCEMQCVSSTTSVLHFGTGGWDQLNGMWLTYESGINGTLHIAWLGRTRWSTYSSVHGDYNKHTYDWDKNNIYKDNVLVASSTLSNYSCPDNLAIFTTILNSTSYESSLKMLGRVYWFKIYDNGTLVRDFIPCIRDNDNKVGVYDIVNNQFYSSASNYELVAGNLV